VASDEGDDEKASNSGEEYVIAAERDYNCQAWQPKDHFKKLLEATCPNYSYPVKLMLKDYTMMINFMTSGYLSKGRKL
jgi:hypothetical protein